MEVVNTIGRRKSAVARVYLKDGSGQITINGKDQKEYFTLDQWLFKLNQPFALTEQEGKFDVTVNVKGGGFTGQVEAIRLGISRALVQLDEESKPALKKEGLMTRDPRMVERKKPGQKKARKKFQFSKR
ncbi:MAG: 30S ribosomal protein S9 [Flavobacteriales bacterium]|jgi:small subunit ribosomal protein S9|nr:30S ribosomal protein S9 [Flavobacteriales bacterium]|tara:strand:+ start:271 stop:657 length:387 start_codon:yes stop_codon:yes gene_type:complete